MQSRLPKYTRDDRSLAAVSSRQITPTSLAVIATIHDYEIVPTSVLVRVVDGHEKNIHRHLHHLYHKGLINRFAFLYGRNPSEFYYYLDNRVALDLLATAGVDPENLDYEKVRRNREKKYCEVNDPKREGKLLYLEHETMISRFHAMLDLACKQSNGSIELSDFQRGPSLYSSIRLPEVLFSDDAWRESDRLVYLPHRPDAFFTLTFPNNPGRKPLHFFYEADRRTTNKTRFMQKLRAHFHFVVKQKRHQEIYGIDRVRAVLTETIDDDWAAALREAASSNMVSGPKPSPLFWFTTSRLFTEPETPQNERPIARYLLRPQVVFGNIWASPVNETLHSLIE
jgi:hypothetical protein